MSLVCLYNSYDNRNNDDSICKTTKLILNIYWYIPTSVRMETNDHEVQVCLTIFEDLTVNLRCKTGIKVAVFNYFCTCNVF